MRKVDGTPAEPEDLVSLQLPEQYTKTISGLDFGWKSENNGIMNLIFTTKTNLRYLSRSPFLIMDGTFKTVPKYV